MLGMWHVGDVGCLSSEIFGTLDVRDVEYSGCGMCDVRSGCGIFGMWNVHDMECSGWDVWDVGCSGYGIFGMWGMFRM